MRDMSDSNSGHSRKEHILQWLSANDSGPTENDGTPVGGKDEQGFAGRLYELCLRALQVFYRQESRSSSRSSILKQYLERLYLWGEPFGVGELDRALGQSDELRDNVIECLSRIGLLLLRRSAPPTPPTQALHQSLAQIKELGSVIQQARLTRHGEQDEIPQDRPTNDKEDESETEGSSDSGSCDTVEDIGFNTTCLMELGPSLAQNLQHAEIARSQRLCLTDIPFFVSGPAKSYVSSVREKFRQANYKLVERLGEANWQRHKAIRQKMENTEQSREEATQFTSETGIACSIFRPYSDFRDSGIGTSVPAHSEYAPSNTSFQSSNAEGEQLSLRVPREPLQVGTGKPFQCFLCRCIVTKIRNRVDWKMHVFADLRPYICTFSDCKDELAQFTSRAAWADHEFTEHRFDETWNCPECSEVLAGASAWEKHLQKMHNRIFAGPQLHLARKTAYEKCPRPIESEECPLCRVVIGKPRRAFVKHVGRHMEEIALMALPRSTDEDSDATSLGTDQLSQGSETAEVLAAQTETEAPEDMSHEQDNNHLIYNVTIEHDLAVQASEATSSSSDKDSTSPIQSIPTRANPRKWTLHAPSNEVEDYIIKCICGFEEDDGNTVYCDLCDTWQHTECYYRDTYGVVPTKEKLDLIDHFCRDCQPRSLDVKGAVERQRIRRKEKNIVLRRKRDERTPRLQCLVEGCPTPFPPARKDSMLKHVRSKHPGYPLPPSRKALRDEHSWRPLRDYENPDGE